MRVQPIKGMEVLNWALTGINEEGLPSKIRRQDCAILIMLSEKKSSRFDFSKNASSTLKIGAVIKPKAEAYLRDFLKIHVPASIHAGDRLRKKKESDENDDANEKAKNKSRVQLFYINKPNISFGKKRKLEHIPLLSNFRINQRNNLRVVKDPNNISYNVIFEKRKPKFDMEDRYLSGDLIYSNQICQEKQSVSQNRSHPSLANSFSQEEACNIFYYREGSADKNIYVTGFKVLVCGKNKVRKNETNKFEDSQKNQQEVDRTSW